MTWTDDRLAALAVKDDVRLRGLEMTRLETFCDAAFAFAVTTLAVCGGEIPTSFWGTRRGAPRRASLPGQLRPIGVLWVAHRQWSRRYGLDDGWTTLISLGMVFVMLVYVYPLRMVASALMAFASGGRLPATFALASARDLPRLFVIYGVGFALQMAMLALLYLRALKAAPALRLNVVETLRTQQEIMPVVASRYAARVARAQADG